MGNQGMPLGQIGIWPYGPRVGFCKRWPTGRHAQTREREACQSETAEASQAKQRKDQTMEAPAEWTATRARCGNMRARLRIPSKDFRWPTTSWGLIERKKWDRRETGEKQKRNTERHEGARETEKQRARQKKDREGERERETEKDKQRQTKTNSKKQTEPNANIQGDKLEKEKKTKRNKETIL